MVQVKKCKCANSAPPSPECRKVSKQMTKDLKDLDSGGKDKDGNWEEEMFILSTLQRNASEPDISQDVRKELNDYLESPTDTGAQDPIKWWGVSH